MIFEKPPALAVIDLDAPGWKLRKQVVHACLHSAKKALA
jgi:hypothetical protein